MEGFKEMLGLLAIQGAIDVVEIHIEKPKLQAFVDCYSYKSKAYIISNCRLLWTTRCDFLMFL